MLPCKSNTMYIEPKLKLFFCIRGHLVICPISTKVSIFQNTANLQGYKNAKTLKYNVRQSKFTEIKKD